MKIPDPLDVISSALGKLIREKEVCFLVLLSAIGTLAPHPANVSPIAALGLFAGTYMTRRVFLLVPVVTVFIVDMSSIGVYHLGIMFFVYVGFLASSLSGRFLVRNKSVVKNAPIAVLVASFAFYLISNFGSWLVHYPLTLNGLVQCYMNGLPYFARTLLGNIFYSTLFLGSYEFILHLFASKLEQSQLESPLSDNAQTGELASAASKVSGL